MNIRANKVCKLLRKILENVCTLVEYTFPSKKSDWGTLVPRINVENGIKLRFLLE
jgi:hypothetical protein